MQNFKKGKRPTIGLFTDVLYEYHNTIISGVIDECKKQDINFICLAGGSLLTKDKKNIPANHQFDDQKNILYEIIKNGENIDALLLISAGLAAYIDIETYTDFCKKYHQIPMVSIGRMIEGIPSLLIDSKTGISDVLNHLINFHGYKKIAFIRGIETNVEAEKRFKIYKDVLAENKIPYDSDIIFKGCFQIADGEDAVRYFIDEKKLDLNAVFASNDNMAIGTIQALNKRKIPVPDQMAVAGYDDLEESKYLSPPLTTAGMSLKNYGHKAVELALKQLRGEDVIPLTTLESKLVIRQSCGCQSQLALNANVSKKNIFKLMSVNFFQKNKDQLIKKIMQIFNNSEAFTDAINKLIDGFIKEIKGKETGFFIKTFTGILREFDDREMDTGIWFEVISLMQEWMPGNFFDSKTISSILSRSRLLIGEYIQLSHAKKSLQNSQFFISLSNIRNRLSCTFELEEILDILYKELPVLDVRSIFLFIYENRISYNYPEPPPEWSRIMLAFNENGKIKYDDKNNRLRTKKLLPEEVWMDNVKFDFFILPLHFREEPIGYIIFKSGLKNYSYYEALSEQISSAIKGSLLLGQVQKHSITLERGIKDLYSSINEMITNINIIANNIDRESVAIDEAVSSIYEIVKNIESSTKMANFVGELSNNLSNVTNEGNKLIKDSIKSINNVETNSQKILDVIQIINDFAQKTNVMALNAAIQASHAGESGKSFSIVSSEIRKLSNDTKNNINIIEGVVKSILSSIKESVEQTGKTGVSLNKIALYTDQNKDTADQLNFAMTEQNTGAKEILKATEELSNTMEEIKNAMKSQQKIMDDFSMALKKLKEV